MFIPLDGNINGTTSPTHPPIMCLFCTATLVVSPNFLPNLNAMRWLLQCRIGYYPIIPGHARRPTADRGVDRLWAWAHSGQTWCACAVPAINVLNFRNVSLLSQKLRKSLKSEALYAAYAMEIINNCYPASSPARIFLSQRNFYTVFLQAFFTFNFRVKN